MIQLAICSFLLATFGALCVLAGKRWLRAVSVAGIVIDVFIASPILVADVSLAPILIVIGFAMAGGFAVALATVIGRARNISHQAE